MILDPSKPQNRSKSEKNLDFERIKKVLKVQAEVSKGIFTFYSKDQAGKYKELLKFPSDVSSKPAPHFLKISPSPLLTLKKTQIQLHQSDFKSLKQQQIRENRRKLVKINLFPSSASQIEAKVRPKPFESWKINNKINLDCKIFVIEGKYPDLRRALLKRGWIENTNSTSIFFDLKYSRNARVPCGIQDWQLFNHFPNNFELTTKWSLAKNLQKDLQKSEKSSLSFFPRCFRLNDSGFQVFSEYFKINFAISIVKEAVLIPFSVHYEKLAAAVQVARRWAARMKMKVEDDDEFQVVQENDWRILNEKDTRMIGTFYSRFFRDDDIHNTALEVLKEVERLDPQFFINGVKNIWIVKPGHKSRGRDITLHTSLRDVYEYINTKEFCVVQKYIENPLLIHNKKFDIRQWVLVSSSDPLKIWLFKKCYLRFSINNFSTKELSNIFTHLTNNSISKKSKIFSESEIEGCMWSLDLFQEWLKKENGYDVWTDRIEKDIKKIVIQSLKSVKDLGRKKSFELFGYDIMIDEKLNTWLIEINSSPAMDYSTVRNK
jgi:tubulin monoglycylase TTLL3/8